MTAGTCLFRGCAVVLGACLALVVGLWIWVATEPGRNEDEARADMREGAHAYGEQLARAAADGRLTDTEIATVFRGKGPGRGLLAVEREAGSTHITAELFGIGPGFLLTHETFVTGCFAFDIAPGQGGEPRTAVREPADETCGALAPTAPSVTPTTAAR
ncbi:hypothetical protein ACFWFI_27280 [Streptomyces sp. NPDC060209]|uniref:hypothetical protein n=1 Tax=Streptomyces sp. NPDC060209 TaxID=3347073 RepID=UPI003668839A